jgi:hypothetical protein
MSCRDVAADARVRLLLRQRIFVDIPWNPIGSDSTPPGSLAAINLILRRIPFIAI